MPRAQRATVDTPGPCIVLVAVVATVPHEVALAALSFVEFKIHPIGFEGRSRFDSYTVKLRRDLMVKTYI